MRGTIAIAAALLAGCSASGGGGTSPVTCVITREGDGPSATWVFAVRHALDRTLKIASVEFAAEGGAFATLGGMAEIAHATKQGSTTIPAGEALEIVHAVTPGRLRLRLTYIFDGSDERHVSEFEAGP